MTNISETLIDHVYSNNPENVPENAVCLSDHYPVCFTRKIYSSYPKGPVHKTINYRDTEYFDETLFLQDIENKPWFLVDHSADVNESLDIFTTLFTSVLQFHAPKNVKRSNTRYSQMGLIQKF